MAPRRVDSQVRELRNRGLLPLTLSAMRRWSPGHRSNLTSQSVASKPQRWLWAHSEARRGPLLWDRFELLKDVPCPSRLLMQQMP